MRDNIKVGLIKGRHEMPVDDYIIIDEIPQELLNKDKYNELLELIYINIIKFVQRNFDVRFKNTIHLYLTGLSRVQHATIKALTKVGFNVLLYDYDKESNTYFPIVSYEYEA